jgi:hypothetical protein
MVILPKPQQLVMKGSGHTPCDVVYCKLPDAKEWIFVLRYLKLFIKVTESPTQDSTELCFVKDKLLQDEAYKIDIEDNKIIIFYGEIVGAYRAVSTFKQIVLQAEKEQISQLYIEDFANIKNRGLMLDISRGKIPNIETLKELIDFLSDLKYNQLQLYMDSFVFEYENFRDYCKDTQPLTVAEILELDVYCKERFMELVPNQNGFGHMGAWLEKEELKHLGIKKDVGTISDTLDPLNINSLKLMEKIYDSLLPHFSSDYVNIGLDEPFSLGQGQTKEICELEGAGKIYVDYLIKVCKLVQEKYRKTPMFWADIAFKYPEQLSRIPKECIVMEWGYETEHHYDRNCRKLRDLNLNFYVCPGTSTWGSITGRTNNMLFNIHSAAEAGSYYGAAGFLLTDWGDGGHPQFPPISYFSYLFGGSYAWNAGSHNVEIAYAEREKVIADCKQYLDRFVFCVQGEKSLCDILYRMGNYYLLENKLVFNNAETIHLLHMAKTDLKMLKEADETGFLRVQQYMESLRLELDDVQANSLMLEEIKCNCDMVCKLSATLYLLIRKEKGHLAEPIEQLITELEYIKEKFQILWKKCNHKVGIEIFATFIEDKIKSILRS